MGLDGAARLRRYVLPAAILLSIGLYVLGRHRPAHSERPALSAPASLSSLPLSGVTVILDPGHGGADAGASRNGVREAALTYRTAVELAQCIHQQGGRVLYTVRSRMLDPALAVTEPPLSLPRDALLTATGKPLGVRRRDSPVTLWQRAAVGRQAWRSCAANMSDNDIFFLSLHYDDFHHDAIRGSLVCVDRRMKAVPLLGRVLAQSFVADHIARDDVYHGLRGIAAGHLGVLDPKYNPIPERILLEVATISNEDDAFYAADAEWRDAMAARITAALIAVHKRAKANRA